MSYSFNNIYKNNVLSIIKFCHFWGNNILKFLKWITFLNFKKNKKQKLEKNGNVYVESVFDKIDLVLLL